MLGGFGTPYPHFALTCTSFSNSPKLAWIPISFDPTKNFSSYPQDRYRGFWAIGNSSWCRLALLEPLLWWESLFPQWRGAFLSIQQASSPTFSLISANTWVFDFPIIEGSPRYLLCRVPCIGPRIFRISSLDSRVVFGLKKNIRFIGVNFLSGGSLIFA